MRFAYYIPGHSSQTITEATLVELGLGDRFRDCFGRLWHLDIVRSDISAGGPDGLSGAWVYANVPDATLPLWKAAAWNSELSDNEKFYVCWLKENDGDPVELKRRKVIDGCDVELLDGRMWHCPTIRKALAIPNVPCSFSRKNGQVSRTVQPAYRNLWIESGKWAAEAFGDGMSESKLVDIATACLAVNYRVGDEELRILGVLGDGNLARILQVAIDVDFLNEALEDQKKREVLLGSLGLQNSVLGGKDSTPDAESPAAS